jgi:hypothetical protein
VFEQVLPQGVEIPAGQGKLHLALFSTPEKIKFPKTELPKEAKWSQKVTMEEREVLEVVRDESWTLQQHRNSVFA